jgi:CDP-glucose 4,6-dehydratase
MDYYRKKRILLTGHTGFKGSWLSKILLKSGADVFGYALEAEDLSLFRILRLDKHMESHIADVRDLESLCDYTIRVNPDVIIHMAAQPIVRVGYQNPVYTYEVNVLGTVNLLEAASKCANLRSLLNVTTDKVYENSNECRSFTEDRKLNGYDPYSNSKSCSELVTDSYRKSFLKDVATSTARAGNAIGGGDFSTDRILPDCARAAVAGNRIHVRNPMSVRPYQHVLDALSAYLTIIPAQERNKSLSGAYNVGPDDTDCLTTGQIADLFCKSYGDSVSWYAQSEENAPHEADVLKLDNTKIKKQLGWSNRWGIEKAVAKTAEWYKAYADNSDMWEVTSRQITEHGGFVR